jgi:hypothetical protein
MGRKVRVGFQNCREEPLIDDGYRYILDEDLVGTIRVDASNEVEDLLIATHRSAPRMSQHLSAEYEALRDKRPAKRGVCVP